MNWAKDATVTPLTDEQACGGFTKGCPVDKAALPVNAANMNAFGRWMCAKMDAVIAAAIVRAFCNPTMANAAQTTKICANLDGYNLITCVDGVVVGLPLSKLGGDGGTDPGGGGGGETCPADPDGVVRAVGMSVTFINGDTSAIPSEPQEGSPASKGWGGTWEITQEDCESRVGEELSPYCETTWTKTAC